MHASEAMDRVTRDKLSWHGLALTVKTNILNICPTQFLISRSKSHHRITMCDSRAFCRAQEMSKDTMSIIGFPSDKAVRLRTRHGRKVLVISLLTDLVAYSCIRETYLSSSIDNRIHLHVQKWTDMSWHRISVSFIFSLVSPSVSLLMLDMMVSLIERQEAAPVPELMWGDVVTPLNRSD